MSTTPVLWDDNNGYGPKVYAELFRAAARHITTCGYNAWDEGEGHGSSICEALRVTALAHEHEQAPAADPARNQAVAYDLALDLEDKLSAVLRLAGALRYSTSKLYNWETEHDRVYASVATTHATAEDALYLLELAAKMTEMISSRD